MREEGNGSLGHGARRLKIVNSRAKCSPQPPSKSCSYSPLKQVVLLPEGLFICAVLNQSKLITSMVNECSRNVNLPVHRAVVLLIETSCSCPQKFCALISGCHNSCTSMSLPSTSWNAIRREMSYCLVSLRFTTAMRKLFSPVIDLCNTADTSKTEGGPLTTEIHVGSVSPVKVGPERDS